MTENEGKVLDQYCLLLYLKQYQKNDSIPNLAVCENDHTQLEFKFTTLKGKYHILYNHLLSSL